MGAAARVGAGEVDVIRAYAYTYSHPLFYSDKAMSAALGSPYEVTGAAWVSGDVWLRLEGFEASSAQSVAMSVNADRERQLSK